MLELDGSLSHDRFAKASLQTIIVSFEHAEVGRDRMNGLHICVTTTEVCQREVSQLAVLESHDEHFDVLGVFPHLTGCDYSVFESVREFKDIAIGKAIADETDTSALQKVYCDLLYFEAVSSRDNRKIFLLELINLHSINI
nr:MAG TPA: hypothetical protein [Crassvirales sp.]